MLKRFFHRCAGADLPLLEAPDCRTDHAKYVGVGTAVFFTAVFASISSSYALYYVFKSPFVVNLGLVWGLFIFSLDRYIVSTMRKGVGWQREWGLAAPRLVIAFFLALVISKPLELKIFDQEITTQLRVMNIEKVAAQEAKLRQKNDVLRPRLESENQRLTAETANMQQQRDAQEALAANELSGAKVTGTNGKVTTGIARAGSNYRRDTVELHKLDRALSQVKHRNDSLAAANRRQLAGMDALTRSELARDTTGLGGRSGLLDRIEAQSRLTNGYRSQIGTTTEVHAGSVAIGWASRVLTLLFILIETAPVLVKLLSPAGPYDFKLNAVEKQVEAREIEAVSRANEDVNRSLQITLGENEQLVKTQLDGNQALLNQINQAQLEVAQEMIDQWKTGELQKLRKPEPPAPAG